MAAVVSTIIIIENERIHILTTLITDKHVFNMLYLSCKDAYVWNECISNLTTDEYNWAVVKMLSKIRDDLKIVYVYNKFFQY
jgi:hypothetical protein